MGEFPKLEECRAQIARLEAAGASVKTWHAVNGTWSIEAEFADRNGVGDLELMTSIGEVDRFIGAFCPDCWRLDRRRTVGGPCSACRATTAE